MWKKQKERTFKLDHRYSMLDEHIYVRTNLTESMLFALIHHTGWTIHEHLTEHEDEGLFGSDPESLYAELLERFGLAYWVILKEESIPGLCPVIDLYDVFHNEDFSKLQLKLFKLLKQKKVTTERIISAYYSFKKRPPKTQKLTTHSENLLRALIHHTADSWRKIADNAHLHFKDCVDLGFFKAKLNNSAEKAYKFVEDGEQGGIDFHPLIQLVEDMQFFLTAGKLRNQMTKEERKLDQIARKVISVELGHSRSAITKVYVG